MFKYLIKKTCFSSNLKCSKFFSKKEKISGGPFKNSILDKIKEKFGVKRPDFKEISESISKDQERDELNASKLDSWQETDEYSTDQTERPKQNITINLDLIETNLNIEMVEDDIELKFNSSKDFLESEYKVHISVFEVEFLEYYSRLRVKEAKARCNLLLSLGFNKFQIKTIINKQ